MKMKTRFFVAVLTLAVGLVAVELRAQNGVARGKVVDENGEAVPKASVILEYRGRIVRQDYAPPGKNAERQYETETNDKGQYTLIVSPGRYRITASKEDYQGAFLERAINPGAQTKVPDIRIVRRQTAAAAAVEEDEVLGPLKRAMELTQAGRLEEAEAAYKEVLAADSSVVEAHYNLGTIYLGRKDYAAAEGEFQQIIELSPETGEAYSALSRVYQEQGDTERALEVLAQGMARKPEDVQMQLNLGVLYNNARRPEEAEAAFKKVEALDPQYVRVQYFLGTLALNRGDVEEAVARFEKYLAEAPEDARDRETAKQLLEQLRPAVSPEP
jgi:tetratricopeptide (TPR) repeat protein